MSAPPTGAGTTVAMARRQLAALLRAEGIDTPEIDARLLIGHALGLDLTGMTSQAERKLDDKQAQAINALAQRRLMREPVARILGRRAFWTLDLIVTPAVLVPRPETETVVEAALAALLQSGPPTRARRIADLGVGSGALILALLSDLPGAFGVGTDRSIAALETASANAKRHALSERSSFLACDYGAALAGGFDLVVANPPYIPTNHIATLAPEVRDFEPRAALDGGKDGLAAYRAIAADAVRLLAPGAAIVLELGIGQMDMVTGLLGAVGLEVETPARVDLAGIPRALTAWRKA